MNYLDLFGCKTNEERLDKVREHYGLSQPSSVSITSWMPPKEATPLNFYMMRRQIWKLPNNSCILEIPDKEEYKSRLIDLVDEDKVNNIALCWIRGLYGEE